MSSAAGAPRRPKRRCTARRRTTSLFLVVLLGAAACGSSDRDQAEAPATTSSERPAAATSTGLPAPSPVPTGAATPPPSTAATSSTPATQAPPVTQANPANTAGAADTADTSTTATATETATGPAGEPGPPATSPPSSPPAVVEASVRTGADGFQVIVRGIDGALRQRIEPTSWRPGCPVELDELRYLEVSHWDFDGAARTGELIVHRDVVDDIESVFGALWTARFPIRSMRLIDDFGGDDFASIEADNTSAFNCRYVEGTTRWSNHATGRAIDINPIENPYVSVGSSSHPASSPYLERRSAPGVIIEGDAVTAAFDAVGWDWGGRWGEPLDYQHFSADGG